MARRLKHGKTRMEKRFSFGGYFYGAVCEVFVLRFIAVLLIWFRLEFVADVNKKRAFYH